MKINKNLIDYFSHILVNISTKSTIKEKELLELRNKYGCEYFNRFFADFLLKFPII